MIGIEKQKEVFNMSKEDNIINDKELETVTGGIGSGGGGGAGGAGGGNGVVIGPEPNPDLGPTSPTTNV